MDSNFPKKALRRLHNAQINQLFLKFLGPNHLVACMPPAHNYIKIRNIVMSRSAHAINHLVKEPLQKIWQSARNKFGPHPLLRNSVSVTRYCA